MFRVRKIDSLDLPELQPYRTMRRQEEHKQQGIFVAEGEKVVRRLLESRLGVVTALLPEKWLAEFESLLQGRPETVEVFVAEKALLETLTGFSMYQGLLAVGLVPEKITLDAVLRNVPRPGLFAAVDTLSSAENLGALVRNCAGFNVACLILSETCASPYLRRAVRSSMGTIFQLPIIESSSVVAALERLRAEGFRVVAAHPRAEGHTLWETDLSGDCCLVFGSEGYGISPKVLEACDEAVAGPMPPTVDSLNVASAAAVFLYEASRQRAKIKP